MARISVFEHGFGPLQRMLLGVITRLVGYVPDPILVFSYRRALFGRQFTPLLHHALRKPKRWTVAEAEIMAAYVAKHSSCEY